MPRGLITKVPVVAFQFNDLSDFLISEGVAGPVVGMFTSICHQHLVMHCQTL